MRLSEPHLDLLSRVGDGQPVWALLYEWQAIRRIPAAFFKPEATVDYLTRHGLVTVDDGILRLTDKGARLAPRLQSG